MRIKLILLATLFAICAFAQEEGDNFIVSFENKYPTNSSSIVLNLMKTKQERLSNSSGGKIQAEYLSDFSEEEKLCIQAATNFWENALFIKKPILLRFQKASLGENGCEFKADVLYHIFGGIAYPQSLGINFLENYDRDATSYDALITINTDFKWDCNFSSETPQGKKDLTTAVIRGIAMSLGFGSSICSKGALRGIVFSTPGSFSPFENQVINSNGVFLNTCPNGRRENNITTSYITGNNLYFNKKNDPDFKLFAPTTFQDNQSLRFFEKDGSVMSYNLKGNDKQQQIDERTLGVLKSIGWNTQKNDISIIGAGIDSTGITSAYTQHSFTAASHNSASISNYYWNFELEDLNGNMISINTSTNPTFVISSISNPSFFSQDVDGDLNGKITLNATIGNQTFEKHYYLHFEIKPSILDISVDTIITKTNSDFFTLDLKVLYKGCNSIYYEIEQYNEPSMYTKTLHEPYIAHVKIGGLIIGRKTWIDLYCYNKYGTTTFTYELDPVTATNISTNKKQTKLNSANYNEKSSLCEYIDVFNLQGLFIKRFTEVDDNYALNLDKGFYILKIKKAENENLMIKKITIN